MKTPMSFANYYLKGEIAKPAFIFPFSNRRNIYSMVSKKYQAINTLNFKPEIKEKIYIALMEFTKAIIFQGDELKKINRKLSNQRKKAIKGLEKALEYPFLFKSSGEVIQKELNRLKEFDKEKKTYHPIKEIDFISEYLCIQSEPTENTKGQIKLVEMMSTPLKIKKGRPSKFFFKVLQIVVFKLLHEKANIPIERAKHLTAKIINEFLKKIGFFDIFSKVKNIKHLTYRDIDNALHSS